MKNSTKIDCLRRTKRPKFIVVATCVVSLSQAVHGQEAKSIKDYLVDIEPSPVSAAEMIGATGSAIHNVQFPKDIWLAFSPISDRNTKTGYGLAMAPARTSFLGIGGQTYFKNPLNRLWGGTSFSYAENASEISGITYKKQGFSIQASSYFDEKDDPIWINYNAALACKGSNDVMDEIVLNKPIGAAKSELLKKAQLALKKCQADAKQPKWNAGKYSISYGGATIRSSSGAAQSIALGDTMALGMVVPAGANGAFNISLRRTHNELDLSTLGGTPAYKKSSIGAVRYTMGVAEDDNFRLLAEISNANSAQSLLSNAVFKSALGIDWRIVEGAWLEFRFGRGKAIDNGSLETKGLVSFNISPSAAGFK